MANKTIKSRVQLKHDTNEHWEAASSSFTPLEGEAIIYTDLNKIKIGDGSTTVGNLPFIDNVEGYLINGVFYEENAATSTVIPAAAGVIYVDLANNKFYRYSGSAYVALDGNNYTYALTIKGNNTTAVEFDQSSAKSLNVVGSGATTVTGGDGTITISSTDQSVTAVANHYTPTMTETKSASGATGTAGQAIQVVTGIEMDAAGHVTGVVSGEATDTHYTNSLTINADSNEVTKFEQNADKSINFKAGNNITLTAGTNEIEIAADDHYTNSLTINGAGTEAVKFEQNANKSLNIAAGSNITVTAASGEITITGNYSEFTGATASADGANGLVKKPVIGDQEKYLKGDGTWAEVDALPARTAETDGKYLMSNGADTDPSWEEIDALPAQSASTVGKVLTSTEVSTGVYEASWEEGGSGSIIRGTHVIVSGEESSFTSPITITDPTKTGVYHNGLLLTSTTNYTISGQTITLVGYTATVGDIFTVISSTDAGTEVGTNMYTTTIAASTGTYASGVTTFTITHNKSTRHVIVQIYDASTYEEVVCDVARTTINTVTLTFNGDVTASGKSYEVMVMGPGYTVVQSGEDTRY